MPYTKDGKPVYEKIPGAVNLRTTEGIGDFISDVTDMKRKDFDRARKENPEFNQAIISMGLANDPATLGTQEKFFNTGGRVPLAGAGAVDKGRRAFMKWLAGITGAGIAAGTGLIKWGKFAGKGAGKTVIKAGDHIIQGTKGMPDWFIPLINRIVKEGT